MDHVRDLLAGSGHPGIAKVDLYKIDSGVRDIEVTCADGRVIRLNITRMSPPVGDNFSEPEPVVTKADVQNA
ncbi:hypothetical protein SAMN05216174_102206 [Actinokineospora iranica]|uniref:Uncharacterized protein n=1 Tax=Actinokineospora iranica TaxID=1271860 RepID=A0A1G6LRF9_9PSEU|nr:hypothetical protein SAMN05216174_102206 [Actinokineospora iranica]